MSASFDPTLLGKIASYTEILTKDPRSTVFVSLSDAYRQMGMLEDALEVAKNGVAALPRYSPGLVHLGRVQFEMGDLDGALASLETAHALDGGSLSALRGLARVLLAKGDKVRARQLLEKGATLHPGDAGLRKMLAALPAPRGAAGTPGGRGEAPIATPTIAEIYLKQGLPERALQVYRDLLLSLIHI
jgi:tetratricopeptide (TPR) repeat protein